MNNTISDPTLINNEQLLELITQPIYWKNLNGIYAGGNSAFTNCLELNAKHDFIGKTDLDFYTPEQAAVIQKQDKDVITSGETKEFIACWHNHADKAVEFHTRKMPWRNAQSEIIGVIGYIKEINYHPQNNSSTLSNLIRKATQEVTQRILTQQEVATLMCQYFDSIVELLPANIYWADNKGRYLGCNERVAKLFGYASPEEISGKTQYDFHPGHPEIAEVLLANDRQVMENNESVTANEIGIDLHGDLGLYLTHKVPMHDEHGNVVGLLGVSFDINEKNRLEATFIEQSHEMQQRWRENVKQLAKLHHEITGQPVSTKLSIVDYVLDIRDYLEKIIALMPGNVYWTDRKGVYLGCNNGILQMVNANSRDEVVGKTIFNFMPKEMADIIYENDQSVMQKKELICFEENGLDKYNRPADFLTYKAPLFNHLHEVIGILGISLDITPRKDAERHLKAAKEEAEAANKAKSEFIENMCHDIRTPLMGIIGSSEVLLHMESEPKKLEFVSTLNKSGMRLYNFINEIVEFAHIESGHLPLQHVLFNPQEVINSVVEMIAPEVQHKKLLLEVDFDPNIPSLLRGDSKRLQRITLNLVGNALKFTSEGKVVIKAQNQKVDDERIEVCLQIIDSGIGIPKDKIDFIFGKFNRMTGTYQGIYRGTGLGLSIVKQFVEEMGGKIEVSSHVGQGSTFTCLIPFEFEKQIF